LKNGFAAPQKSFPLRGQPDVTMIHDKPLTSSLERQKTFDSPLANHFSAVMQISLIVYPLFEHNSSSLNFTGLRDSLCRYFFEIIQAFTGAVKSVLPSPGGRG
jgi:hypothetical protein